MVTLLPGLNRENVDPELLTLASDVFLANDQADKALSTAERLIGDRPNDPRSFVSLGRAQLPGAAIGPASMALIMQAFPEEDRVKAMGWWSLVGAGAPVIGLVVGGPVVAALGWRVIFIAQVPLSLAALALAYFVLRETPRREREPLDLAGAGTLAGATVSALLALTIGSRLGYDSPVVVALLVSAPELCK